MPSHPSKPKTLAGDPGPRDSRRDACATVVLPQFISPTVSAAVGGTTERRALMRTCAARATIYETSCNPSSAKLLTFIDLAFSRT